MLPCRTYFRIAVLALAAALSPIRANSQQLRDGAKFEYNRQIGSYYIIGWIENPYSFFCGVATHKDAHEKGYVSLYKHVYWLQGNPHESWNFDVQTNFEAKTEVRVEMLIDGRFFALYPENIVVEDGLASSTSDLCDEGIPGLCPDRKSVLAMSTLVQRISNARQLSFNLSNGKSSEDITLDVSTFASARTGIDACFGDLLSRSERD